LARRPFVVRLCAPTRRPLGNIVRRQGAFMATQVSSDRATGSEAIDTLTALKAIQREIAPLADRAGLVAARPKAGRSVKRVVMEVVLAASIAALLVGLSQPTSSVWRGNGEAFALGETRIEDDVVTLRQELVEAEARQHDLLVALEAARREGSYYERQRYPRRGIRTRRH
jgi:hypothetical protein